MSITNVTLTSVSQKSGASGNFIINNPININLSGGISADVAGGKLGVWLSGGNLSVPILLSKLTIANNASTWTLSNENFKSILKSAGQVQVDGLYTIGFTDGTTKNSPAIGSSHAFTIDTTAPIVNYLADNFVSSPTPQIATGPILFYAYFSEAVTGVTSKSFTANNGSVTAVTASGTANTYIVSVTPKSNLGSGNVTLNLLAGGAIDAAGNKSLFSNLSNLFHQPVDTLKVGVSSITATGNGISAGKGDLHAGHVVTLTVNMNQTVTVNGTPYLTLNNGGVANYVKGSGSSTLVFSYTVAANQSTSQLAVSSISGGTVTDVLGNKATIAGNTSGALQIDSTLPTPLAEIASGTHISNGNGVLNTGAQLTLTVTMNEVVNIHSGSPTLILNDGGTAIYVSGSGTKQLVFQYTVANGENSSALQIADFNVNGAKIVDAKGNAVVSGAYNINTVGTLQIETSIAAPVTALTADTGISSSDGVTANNQLTVTLATAATSWEYSQDGGKTWTTGSGNTFNLADGYYPAGTVLVKQIDAAGNTSSNTSLAAVTIATINPTVSSISESATGISNQSAESITLTANAEALNGNTIASVIIKDTNNSTFSGTAMLSDGSWTYQTSGLSDGTHHFFAVVTDTAGNQYNDYNLPAVIVTTQAPIATIFGSTTANTDTITVIASAENTSGNSISQVAIYDNGNFVGDATSNNNGTWTYNGTEIAGSQNSFYALVTDVAGKSSQTATLTNPASTTGLTAASYNAATGQLILIGNNLSTNAGDYALNNLSLSGFNNSSYQLSGGTLQNNSTSNQLVFNLNNTDQLALAGLLNQNGTLASDSTTYHLSAVTGWTQGGGAVNSLNMAVSNYIAPTITGVSFNAATSVLTVTGNHFADLGNGSGINLADLKLNSGNISESIYGTLHNVSNNGFSVQLPNTYATVFNSNGTSSYDGNLYNLSANSGWDTAQSAAITSQTINVTGNGMTIGGIIDSSVLSDISTLAPFRSVTINSDNNAFDSDSATISFSAANGLLSGSGLSAAVVNNGIATYTLATTTAAGLQGELQSLLFTPTAHQLAATQSVSTNFVLTVNAVASFPNEILSPGSNLNVRLATDNAGNVYLSDASTNSIQEYSATGSLLNSFANVSNQTTDSSGNLFAVEINSANMIDEFNASGQLLRRISVAVNNPLNLITDRIGDLFVAGAGNAIEEFDASGNVLRTFTLSFSQQSGITTNMATDRLGNLYVTDTSHNSVEEFNASGNLLKTISSGLDKPTSLATDSNGDVYIANFNKNSVDEFNAAGSLLQHITRGIINPYYLATDNSGDLYVVNSGSNNNIEEFSASGSLLRTLTGCVTQPVIDNNGNIYITSQNSTYVDRYAPSALVMTGTDANTQLTVTATVDNITATANGSLSNPTLDSMPHSGDLITIADASSFDSTAISIANVNAAGGGSLPTLADWVAGALASTGANIAQHEIAWFQFSGNTYLVEQANAQGTAFGSGDSLIRLVGIFNESSAHLTGNVLTI